MVKPDQFLVVLRHLVADVEELLDLESGILDEDFRRISSSVKSRGLRILLLDFPSLCNALERALDRGVYLKEELLFHSRGYPSIFLPIYTKIFTELWDLRPLSEIDPMSIRCLRTILRLFKKYRIDPPETAKLEKIHEFVRIEEGLPSPALTWGGDELVCLGRWPSLSDLGLRFHDKHTAEHGDDTSGDDESRELALRDLTFVQSVCDRVTRSFKFNSRWFTPKHGPGAVSEQFKGSKYDFPSWPKRLEIKFPFEKYGLANLSFWDQTGDFNLSFLEPRPAKLIPVPKDYKGPRLIASEPISAQYVQQGLLNVLRENTKRSVLRHSIDFGSQDPSKELCLTASASGQYSTIDLSSASDRLSCAVVESAFRSNYSLLELLNSARTHQVYIPDLDVSLDCKKFAAQGAAFTFPVQSIVYALICIGVLISDKPDMRLADAAKEVRVFGDDMIVPTRLFSRICKVLTMLSLQVNQEKSFSRGFFRESCGMDAYNGVDVSTSSILTFFNPRDPSTIVSAVECANNLFNKGFTRASTALQETIPWKIRKNIPVLLKESTVLSLIGNLERLPRDRHNVHLYRLEHLCLVVENKVEKSRIDGHHRLLQWFHEKPSPDSVWKSGEVIGVKARCRLRWVHIL